MDLKLPRQLFAAAAGALEGHQQGSPELRLCAVQLILRHVALDLAEFFQCHRHELFRLVFARAGIDGEQPTIREGRGEGVDGIDEPALFPDFLEEARGHAAAEQGREQLRRRVQRVRRRDGGEAEDQMHLVEVTILPELATRVASGLRRCLLRHRQVGEVAVGEVEQRLMLQRAGSGDDHPARAIVAAHVAGQRLPAHRLDGVLSAEDRAAHGLAAIGGSLEMVEDDVIRRVVRLADFLEDDAAFALQLLRHEGRMRQDVPEDIGGEGQILLQHLGVEGGILAGGIGVEVPADILDLPRDGSRVPPRRALEGHVFEEVGDTVLRRCLVPRAGMDIGADGAGFHTWHRLRDHGEAVRQARQADGVVHVVQVFLRPRGVLRSPSGRIAAGMGPHEGLDRGQVGGKPRQSLRPVI